MFLEKEEAVLATFTSSSIFSFLFPDLELLVELLGLLLFYISLCGLWFPVITSSSSLPLASSPAGTLC